MEELKSAVISVRSGDFPMDQPFPYPANNSQTCPLCGNITDDIRRTEVPFFVFLVYFHYWRDDSVTGCPACLRAVIRRRAALNLLTANLLFVGVFFALFYRYLETYRAYRPTAPVPPPSPMDPEQRRRRDRMLAIVVVAGCSLVAAMGVGIVWMVEEGIIPYHSADHFLDRGMVEYRQMHYSSSIRLCDQAIRLEPENATAYAYRGLAKLRLGRDRESAARFRAMSEPKAGQEALA